MSEEKKEVETTAESNGKKGAKDYSLVAQIVAAIWVAGWHTFKFAKIIAAGQFELISTPDIVLSGFSIAACFTPVYFSIIMDKIKDIKFGSSK